MSASAVQETIQGNSGSIVNIPLMMSTATLLMAGGRWAGGVESRLLHLEDDVRDVRRVLENLDTKIDKILDRKK
tara:strand:- start:2518 stop:2739 length:222 start_codon:yes stop_codon:yes gene_type:complete